MSFEGEIFIRSKPDFDRLPEYGFTMSAGVYRLDTVLASSGFSVCIEITPAGAVTGAVIDPDTLDEYNAFRDPHRTGEFVGDVRKEYTALLEDIRKSCFTDMPFAFDISNDIARRVYQEFSEKPDFPFSSAQTYGVFRNKSNNKWYGLIMNVTKDKITKKTSDKDTLVEIINLKVQRDKISGLIDNIGIYPCYHMNKGSWVSVLLDGTVSAERVMNLLAESKRLTDKTLHRTGSFIIPANPKYFDIEDAFADSDIQFWKQCKGVKQGDTVYIYVGSPVSAILYKCRVIQTDIPYNAADGKIKISSLMKIEIITRYDKSKCPLYKMREFGVTTVRGVRFMTDTLEKFLDE